MPDNQPPLRALVIGTGHIGQQHLLALAKVENCIVAVCDRSAAMAELTADRYTAAAWYSDAADALTSFHPDVAHICTPASSHVPLAELALVSGAHALVEKPITESVSEWTRLREISSRTGRLLVEDHNYWFNPPVLKVRELIKSGDFGDVVHVDIQFALNIHGPKSAFSDPHLPHPVLRSPGGAIADFLTHLSYLTVGFVGGATSVRTNWQKRERSSLLPHDEMRALVVCQNGTANLSFSSHSQPDVFRLVVHGTRMTAHINLFENTCHVDRKRSGPGALTALLNSLSAGINYSRGGMRSLVAKLSSSPGGYAGLHTLIQQFYSHLREDRLCPVSLDQIEATNRLVEALTAMENRI